MAELGVEKKSKKDKTLIFCQTGISSIVRQLSRDLLCLLPHCRPEAKYGREPLADISEVLDLRNANRCVFLQLKKHRDPYMWISNSPNGPTAKFLIENIETLDRNFGGNCRIGTRAILSFSQDFDRDPPMKIIKRMLISVFRTPSESRPFDHIFCFDFVDNRIWFRNYQIINHESQEFREIGPRFTLNPVSIFEGTFRGQIIYKNPDYVAPSKHFKTAVKQATIKNKKRMERRTFNKEKAETLFRPHDDINDVFNS
ncbi:Ribosome biogenesis protein BRX1 [Thelohanellus kitauei]|uniref:Ribosome biogenesis protein BRX1 homolog n=1 Tax=Thelohanellus kitauei TaxID=669202 RepID=A0A0C2MB94_THEKT|nr:Ribosome biogenesis protein BRX1 [Thelohanellus kitauei]